MKKIFLIIVLIVFKVNSLFAAILFCFPQFGTGTNCQGFGFCRLTMYPNTSSYLSLSSDEMILTVVVDRQYIKERQSDKMIYFEGKKSVTFDEAWDAPVDINRALHAKKAISIPVGTYPMSYENGYYTIKIMLSKSIHQTIPISRTKTFDIQKSKK